MKIKFKLKKGDISNTYHPKGNVSSIYKEHPSIDKKDKHPNKKMDKRLEQALPKKGS